MQKGVMNQRKKEMAAADPLAGEKWWDLVHNGGVRSRVETKTIKRLPFLTGGEAGHAGRCMDQLLL